MTDAKARV